MIEPTAWAGKTLGMALKRLVALVQAFPGPLEEHAADHPWDYTTLLPAPLFGLH